MSYPVRCTGKVDCSCTWTHLPQVLQCGCAWKHPNPKACAVLLRNPWASCVTWWCSLDRHMHGKRLLIVPARLLPLQENAMLLAAVIRCCAMCGGMATGATVLLLRGHTKWFFQRMGAMNMGEPFLVPLSSARGVAPILSYRGCAALSCRTSGMHTSASYVASCNK